MKFRQQAQDVAELHRMAEMLQHLDVGLVMLDRDYRICFWNTFMENHSGLPAQRIQGQELLALFPDIPRDWFHRKVESVFLLNNHAFTVWEQRPSLFAFKNFRPLTGASEFMYQNTVIIPLTGLDGEISHVALIVYDVTDAALGKQALTLANTELEKRSRIDRLTGLNNRGYWEEIVVQEFRRYQRTAQPTSLAMVDIDHFKQINDRYGHQAGDEVIRHTANLLRKNQRETDIAGRYGGEEFGVVLVNTDANSARYFSERLRKAAESSTVRHGGVDIRFTVSVGVAAIDPGVANHKVWIDHSDQALYRSKQNGRNRVTIFDASGHDPIAQQS